MFGETEMLEYLSIRAASNIEALNGSFVTYIMIICDHLSLDIL